MKILHVIKGIQKAAGTSVFCGEILNQLVNKGHDCRLLVSERTGDIYPIDERVKIVYDGLFAVLRDGWSADIVHIHGMWTPLLHKAHVWARKNNVKIVFSPHGMLAPWAMVHKRWKKFLPWYLYQHSDIVRASLIHSTAAKESKWIRDLGFKNKMVEIPLGTNLPAKLVSTDYTKKKTLLFVGRIYPVKGLDLLIRAWANIKDIAREKDWCVSLVGPDQAGYMQTLKDLCVHEGLRAGEDIIFTGPLYGREKDKAYLGARALILPSYTENFGGVVVDAMSFGLPVLTSEATPWNFLDDIKCGFHFPLSVDALSNTLLKIMLLSDNERSEMGKCGRKLVEEKYSWTAIVEEMIRAYNGLKELRKD